MKPRPPMLVDPVAWDPLWCAAVRAAIDRGVAAPAEVQGSAFIVDSSARRALDVEVESAILDAAEERLLELRPRLEAHFGLTLRHHEGAGFVRYTAGGRYGRHQDQLLDDAEFRRTISIVVFLSGALEPDDAPGMCRGGTLRIYPDDSRPIDVEPVIGTLVAFPAGMQHEVLPVTFGTRDVVIDWFY